MMDERLYDLCLASALAQAAITAVRDRCEKANSSHFMKDDETMRKHVKDALVIRLELLKSLEIIADTGGRLLAEVEAKSYRGREKCEHVWEFLGDGTRICFECDQREAQEEGEA